MAEVRICEFCGHANPISAMACEECGADLAFVQPTEQNDSSIPQKKSWLLTSVNSGMEFPVRENIEVGRMSSDLADLLNASDYTSRYHAKLSLENNAFFVTDESTNGTFVNDKRLSKGATTELHSGDILRFADVAFKVSCHEDSN